MDIARGLAMCMRQAWHCLDFVIFDANSFGGNEDITLKHILILILGGIMLIKFIHFCMGGNFDVRSNRVNYSDFSEYVTHPWGNTMRERRGYGKKWIN